MSLTVDFSQFRLEFHTHHNRVDIQRNQCHENTVSHFLHFAFFFFFVKVGTALNLRRKSLRLYRRPSYGTVNSYPFSQSNFRNYHKQKQCTLFTRNQLMIDLKRGLSTERLGPRVKVFDRPRFPRKRAYSKQTFNVSFRTWGSLVTALVTQLSRVLPRASISAERKWIFCDM